MNEGNGGALVARLADVWRERDAARMAELDRLTKTGTAKPQPQETPMPCPDCKSPGAHKRDCPRRPLIHGTSSAGPRASFAPAPLAALPRSPMPLQLPALTDDDLAALGEQIVTEIKRRQSEAEQRIGRMRGLREKLGEAV